MTALELLSETWMITWYWKRHQEPPEIFSTLPGVEEKSQKSQNRLFNDTDTLSFTHKHRYEHALPTVISFLSADIRVPHSLNDSAANTFALLMSHPLSIWSTRLRKHPVLWKPAGYPPRPFSPIIPAHGEKDLEPFPARHRRHPEKVTAPSLSKQTDTSLTFTLIPARIFIWPVQGRPAQTQAKTHFQQMGEWRLCGMVGWLRPGTCPLPPPPNPTPHPPLLTLPGWTRAPSGDHTDTRHLRPLPFNMRCLRVAERHGSRVEAGLLPEGLLIPQHEQWALRFLATGPELKENPLLSVMIKLYLGHCGKDSKQITSDHTFKRVLNKLPG